jgi:hypothetical protein
MANIMINGALTTRQQSTREVSFSHADVEGLGLLSGTTQTFPAYVCFPPIADVQSDGDDARMSDYFRQIHVLERVNPSKAIRYTCYEDLLTGRFCVSGADILRSPEHADTLSFQAVTEVDQFTKRGLSRWFDTLLEAVEDFALLMERERQS